jgi:hypothetical protein
VEQRSVDRRPKAEVVHGRSCDPADIQVERRVHRDPHRENVDQFRELATATSIRRVTWRE